MNERPIGFGFIGGKIGLFGGKKRSCKKRGGKKRGGKKRSCKKRGGKLLKQAWY